MSEATWEETAFAQHLQELAGGPDGDGEGANDSVAGRRRAPDRAALAALRRGLGKGPGEAAELYRYVVPYARPEPTDAHYVVASLFGLHPKSWLVSASTGRSRKRRPTNLGVSMGRLREIERERRGGDASSVEQRFTALLNAHAADLPEHLRRVVSLLKAREVRVDWAQLLHDLRRWDAPGREVQRAWAEAYWAPPAEEAAVASDAKGETGTPPSQDE
jgi:CRISPR system Cascade subunit CasB